MRQFGLIGRTLSHSFSVDYFTQKFSKEGIENARYDNFELADISDFPGILSSVSGLCGLNVTIPYKESVIPYLDELDNTAREIGSVNTITFNNGRTKGYNTDIVGISETLKPYLDWYMADALILGTGGSAKTVGYFFKKAGIEPRFVTRENSRHTNKITYRELTADIIRKYKLIVNCTPVGTHPHTDESPDIPYEGITDMHVVFDLVYNPPLTMFLDKALEKGATALNGSKMLIVQAEAAWKLWNE